MPSQEEFSDFYYHAADGLRLHARIYGERRDGALPVACLPGLTRNARDFHRLALFLSQHAPVPRQVIAFDYRGRGLSGYDPNWQNYTIGTELIDVLMGLDAAQVQRALFIGTSRGGLIVQVMAAMRPRVIAAAVLNDIGPAVERQGLELIRRYLGATEKLASAREAIDAQKKIHGHAFPALADEDWAAMVDALYRIENGMPVADFDPELVKTLTAADPDQPLPELWKEFDMLARSPVLAIRGENSQLLSAATLGKMAARSPMVETLTIAGQGHAPLLETGRLPQKIADFFDRADPH